MTPEEIEQLSIDCEAEAHYYEGLRKLGESLGYEEDGDGDYFPWPVADMFQEIERLRKELKAAEDVIKFARDITNEDEARKVFEDFLEVIE
jgi:hypothetical protein